MNYDANTIESKENDLKIKEIQYEIKKLNSEIKQVSFVDVVEESRQIIIKSVLDAFGLPYFADRAGGNITTLRNFKKGITAARDTQKYKEYVAKQSKYDRRPYNLVQESYRDPIIKSDKPIKSGYTGNTIPHDGRSELEHIVSAAEIEKAPENNLFMTQDERVALAYKKENLTMIEKGINHSKQDMPLEEWLSKKRKKNPGKGLTEAEYFGIDINQAKMLDKRARNKIKKEQIKAQIKKQGTEILENGLSEGLKLGKREVLGLVLVEFADASIRCIRKLINLYKKGAFKYTQILTEFKVALLETRAGVLNKYKEIISKFKDSVLSGFLSTVLTFIINNFITTAKQIVTIVREMVLSLVEAGKILLSGNYETQDEKVSAATDKVLNSMTICLTTLIAVSVQKALIGIPYNDCFSQAIAAILVGLTVTIATCYFEKMNSEILATTASVATTAGKTIEVINTVQNIQKEREQNIQRLNNSTKSLLDDIK